MQLKVVSIERLMKRGYLFLEHKLYEWYLGKMFGNSASQTRTNSATFSMLFNIMSFPWNLKVEKMLIGKHWELSIITEFKFINPAATSD